MLSVALLICIVWNLGHGDINFRSFKEEKNKGVTVVPRYNTMLLQYQFWPFISPLPRPLGAIHSFSYSGEKRREV